MIPTTTSVLLLLLGLVVALAQLITAVPTPTGEAISVTYFETGASSNQHKPLAASDGQWTLLHPLRINHAPTVHEQRQPALKPHSVEAPLGHNYGPARDMTYFDNDIREVDTHRAYAKPPMKKKKYLVKVISPPQPAGPPPGLRAVTYVHPYPERYVQQPQQPNGRMFPPQQQGSGINVQQLVNKFGLVGMKPLLNPKVARQLVPPEPSLQAIESRLMLTPFTFYRANQMFVPLNNRPVPIKAMAVALQQARQGSILLNAPPQSVDSDLIGMLARSQREYGFEKEAARLYSAATNELYDGDVAPRSTTKKQSWKRMDQDEGGEEEGGEAQVGLAFFGPDFRRLTKSKRMRVSTLGSLGYQS